MITIDMEAPELTVLPIEMLVALGNPSTMLIDLPPPDGYALNQRAHYTFSGSANLDPDIWQTPVFGGAAMVMAGQTLTHSGIAINVEKTWLQDHRVQIVNALTCVECCWGAVVRSSTAAIANHATIAWANLNGDSVIDGLSPTNDGQGSFTSVNSAYYGGLQEGGTDETGNSYITIEFIGDEVRTTCFPNYYGGYYAATVGIQAPTCGRGGANSELIPHFILPGKTGSPGFTGWSGPGILEILISDFVYVGPSALTNGSSIL